MPHDWGRGSTLYTVLLTLGVTLSSYGAWQWLERNPQYLGSHGHSHAEQGDPGSSPLGLQAQVVSRSIEVRMDDQMRFSPDTLQVRAGETVRLVVHNAGKVEHELVLGTEEDIRAHAEAMKKGSDHSHGHAGGAAISVAPGQTGELVVTFAQAGALQMACLIPGHYEAGMRGQVQVSERPANGTKASGHDHSTHKH